MPDPQTHIPSMQGRFSLNSVHAVMYQPLPYPPSGYYMPGMEDRLLVEKLLNTCLVPYNLESADRMKKLFLLFATIDENASKAFIEVQTKQGRRKTET